MVKSHLNRSYIITTMIVILWLFNYHICNYLFKDNLIKWWDLKQSIYNMCIILALHIPSKIMSPYYKIVIDFIIGIILSSIIDRLWFETRVYDSSDIIMLTINIIYTLYNLMKCWKTWRKKHKKSY